MKYNITLKNSKITFFNEDKKIIEADLDHKIEKKFFIRTSRWFCLNNMVIDKSCTQEEKEIFMNALVKAFLKKKNEGIYIILNSDNDELTLLFKSFQFNKNSIIKDNKEIYIMSRGNERNLDKLLDSLSK